MKRFYCEVCKKDVEAIDTLVHIIDTHYEQLLKYFAPIEDGRGNRDVNQE